MIKAQLIDLGSRKINKIVTVKSVTALHNEIGKHLSSKGWGMEETETTEIDNIYFITAGFRTVGQVKILEASK